mmetsp:Transcript_270/g.325  ORF Transcript_270/g.325 Transcript_270/m.325 type:complete len:121 (-) Transcript_270:2578-2940(-)
MTPVVSLLVSLFGLSFCCFCCWNGGTNNGGVIHMDVLFGWKSLVSRIDTMIHFCCSSCCGGVQTKLEYMSVCFESKMSPTKDESMQISHPTMVTHANNQLKHDNRVHQKVTFHPTITKTT